MNRVLTLVIMAAGVGSRYGGLKQLDPIGPSGETLLEYSLYDAKKAGFSEFVFVVRPETEDLFQEHLDGKLDDSVHVRYAHQEIGTALPAGFSVPEGRTKPWGTGHALLSAKDLVHGPLAVINADDYYGPHAFELLADFLMSNRDDYALVGYVLEKTLSVNGSVSRGICSLNERAELMGVVEHTRIGRAGADEVVSVANSGEESVLLGREWVSLNCWGFQESVFEALEIYFELFLNGAEDLSKAEFYLPFVVDALIKKRAIVARVLKTEGDWYGVTYKEDKKVVCAEIERLVSNGFYPESLWG